MEQNANQQNDNNKVDKKFKSAFSKLLSLMGGELDTSTKVPNDAVNNLVTELLTERREKAKAEFKVKASIILDKKIEFDRFVKQKQKEMEDAILNKKKEFTQQIEDLFALVENINQIHQDYLSSLTEIATEEEETDESKID